MPPVAPVLKEYPTAQALLADTALTPVSTLPSLPGLELGTRCQLVPSQCSVKVTGVAWASVRAGLGLGSTAQLVPSPGAAGNDAALTAVSAVSSASLPAGLG